MRREGRSVCATAPLTPAQRDSSHKPYSEEVYRQALARRHQLAVKSSRVELQWKTCAGFSKITAITS